MPAEENWEDHFLAKYIEARHRRLSSAGFLEKYVDDLQPPTTTNPSLDTSGITFLPFRLPSITEEDAARGHHHLRRSPDPRPVHPGYVAGAPDQKTSSRTSSSSSVASQDLRDPR